jgi:hypothetical protein
VDGILLVGIPLNSRGSHTGEWHGRSRTLQWHPSARAMSSIDCAPVRTCNHFMQSLWWCMNGSCWQRKDPPSQGAGAKQEGGGSGSHEAGAGAQGTLPRDSRERWGSALFPWPGALLRIGATPTAQPGETHDNCAAMRTLAHGLARLVAMSTRLNPGIRVFSHAQSNDNQCHRQLVDISVGVPVLICLVLGLEG